MNRQNLPTILAPAGGRSQFLAALASGADEIYVGLRSFSARAGADNFTPRDLGELIPIAHKFGARVLLALNTLITEKEFPAAMSSVAEAHWLGVDAVIIQDLGVAASIHRVLPQLPIHASTQMSVHDVQGALLLAEHGFNRVVLAREMTLSEIQATVLALKPLGVETEVFCHGSLCYSVSGDCLFGGVEHGRSGNRGTCPYPCRHAFRRTDTNADSESFLFSMRDLDTLKILGTLVGTGISALKIEGRKKDAQYVASTVFRYRQALNQIFGRETLRANAPSTARSSEFHALAEADAKFSFQRSTTTLFLTETRPVISLNHNQPSHAGVECGLNLQRNGNQLSFIATIALDTHDGLMLLTEKNNSYGFSCSAIHGNKGRGFHVKAGERATITLPPELTTELKVSNCEHIRLFKTRSSRLREQVEKLERPPAGERLRFLRPISTNVTLANSKQLETTSTESICDLILDVRQRGRALPSVSMTLHAAQPNRADFRESFESGLKGLFAVFGDAELMTTDFELKIEPLPYLPTLGELRRAKRELTPLLQRVLEEELRSLAEELSFTPVSLASAPSPDTSNSAASQLPQLICSIPTDPDLVSPLLETALLPNLGFVPSVEFSESAVMVGYSFVERWISATKQSPLIQLPPLLFDSSIATWKAICLHLVALGVTRFSCTNLWNVRLLTQLRAEESSAFELHSSFFIPVWNSRALRFLTQLGVHVVHLSPEDATDNHLLLAQSPSQTENLAPFIFGHPPLFTSRNCALAQGRCRSIEHCAFPPSRTIPLRDPGQRDLLLVTGSNCQNRLYSKRPCNRLSDVPRLLNAGYRRFAADLSAPFGPTHADDVQRVTAEVQRLVRTLCEAQNS